jgi:stage V sporulation protein B
MVGYFTAANRIGTLAAVEVAEQLLYMAVAMTILTLWAGHDPVRASMGMIFGSGISGCFCLLCLTVLRLREKAPAGPRLPVRARLLHTAVPLALADDLKAGISTTENLMVPKRLALYSGADAMAQFGTVCGMVFPVLMFPAAILYGLADLLIPELARCNASDSRVRIRYLARRSLRLALFYGIACGGVMYLLAEPLCLALYQSSEAGEYLRWFSLLTPMLYCDAVIDAMNKGLGKQHICVRFNILTSVMDVVGLYLLLPQLGMTGYFVSFLISHAVNFLLSLALLLKTACLHIALRVPLLTILATMGGFVAAQLTQNAVAKPVIFLSIAFGGLYVLGILYPEDLSWLRSVTGLGKKIEKT